MCDIDVTISTQFFSLFLFNEMLLLTIIWVFLETPVVPVWLLQPGWVFPSALCSWGTVCHGTTVTLCPKLCEAGVQQDRWDGLG